jgi:hypothetical protein
MRETVRKLLLVGVAASLLGVSVGFAPSSARAYHTYKERILDDTAYSLARREARIGLIQLSYGILDQLQVTTYTFPWILGAIFQDVAPNVELKSRFYDKRKLALSASVGFLTGTILQTDDTKLRYVVVPITAASSVRINSDISIHTTAGFTATGFPGGTTQAGGRDVAGAVVISLLQLSEMFEWRLSRVAAFTLTVRWIPWVDNADFQATIDIEAGTDATIEADVTTQLENAWSIIPGFVFSWARANLKFGVGYGDLFLPGIGLVVPGAFPRSGTPAPVVEFDVFVRF